MSQLQLDSEESPQLDPFTAHDIFLSHSGAQKGFVKDLYKALSGHFNTFFDITDHSLPLGEHFPSLIFRASSSCKLAVVVLSEDFVCSRWPMLELVAFVDAIPLGVKILPLFYELGPADLKNKDNLERWSKAWEALANQDRKKRIDVLKWGEALQTLCSQNGLIFDRTLEGEQAYLDKIVSGISQVVPPAIKFDTHHIHGKDRLCKVILDKFKEMEQQSVIFHKNEPKFRASYVLGLHGLPGSGKSTICRCLHEHFFPLYGAGKVLYMELPTNPSRTDLVHKFKDLLRLTDFRERVSLAEVSELEQVEYLLRKYQLPASSVFLVVDNIPGKLWDMVTRIVKLCIGLGSKVILVARALNVLRPILHSVKTGNHCICESMCVPSIDESEAVKIILETGSVCTLQQHLTPKQRDIVLGVVHMCKFKDGCSYLPLVMKTMGAMLNEDVEGWGRNLESFWRRVEAYKEDAVKELIGESFKTLPSDDHLLLFLDVVLFIRKLHYLELEEVYALLSLVHESTLSRMEIMMKDLERHCFLRTIYVHDVYLEFAKSLSGGFSHWCWRNYKNTDMEGLRKVMLEEKKGEHVQVRMMILEVGEGCERVDLRGFSSMKALVVRNCKSLARLSLGGFSSLVSLDIKNCASFERLECNDASLLNVKRLHIDQTNIGEKDRVYNLQYVQEWKQVPYLQSFMNLLQRVIAPARCNVLEVGVLARQMRFLKVLNLQNTGIRRLEDMGRYCPQLQDLTIIEHRLEALELGILSKLQTFHFSDNIDSNAWEYMSCWKCSQGNPRFLLQGKELLMGCPQLKRVSIESAYFEEGRPRIFVKLQRCFYTATELPDLSRSARHMHSRGSMEDVVCKGESYVLQFKFVLSYHYPYLN